MQLCKLLIGSFLFALVITIPACYYDNEEDLYGPKDTSSCDTTGIRYSVEVAGILQKNCYSCHSTGNIISGIPLDSHTTARKAAMNGTLMGTVKHKPGFSPMPQGGGKLSDCDIAALQAWVDAGTPNN